MKENSKKVPDAPKRLWIFPYHLNRLGGLVYANGHSYKQYWEGHEYPKNLDKDVEYISLSQSWHEAKEVPQDMHTLIIVANKDFSVAISISLARECRFGCLDDTPNKAKLNNFRKNLKFAYWAYLKDIVPTKLKKGGKQ